MLLYVSPNSANLNIDQKSQSAGSELFSVAVRDSGNERTSMGEEDVN